MALTTLCQPYDLTPPEEREEAKEDNKKKKY
jgi:hypothetical protein